MTVGGRFELILFDVNECQSALNHQLPSVLLDLDLWWLRAGKLYWQLSREREREADLVTSLAATASAIRSRLSAIQMRISITSLVQPYTCLLTVAFSVSECEGMTMSEVNNNAYRIETERLVIRCYEPKDAALLTESVTESLDYLKPWLPWVHVEPEPLEVKVQRLSRFRGEFDLQKDFTYGIFSKDETKLLGGTGLHTRLAGTNEFEIGYWIHKDFVGRGLATEAAGALAKVAFSVLHGVHRLEIRNDVCNLASAAIAAKLGFKHEGTLRSKYAFLDEWKDLMIWGLLEEEYPDTRAFSMSLRVYDAFGTVLCNDHSKV
jgi:RimJ/RimL family protein N-acetyltransferase